MSSQKCCGDLWVRLWCSESPCCSSYDKQVYTRVLSSRPSDSILLKFDINDSIFDYDNFYVVLDQREDTGIGPCKRYIVTLKMLTLYLLLERLGCNAEEAGLASYLIFSPQFLYGSLGDTWYYISLSRSRALKLRMIKMHYFVGTHYQTQ